MKRTGRQQTVTSPETTRIGIFWVFEGQVLSETMPVKSGELAGDCVDAPVQHMRVWREFQTSIPKLRHLEYEQVPRGRVVYNQKENRFYVFLDRVLMTSAIKRLVMKAFNLAPKQTKWMSDPHYTTDPDALDRLFI